MNFDLLYDRHEYPFGQSWEIWVALWCTWMLSIPKKNNPSLDKTGKYCSMNQNNENVWFLTGTFGNIVPVKRKCTIPIGKAIFFPILEKEDSLKEDSDLDDESELIKRSRDATNRLTYMEAWIDGVKIEDLEDYRVQSEVFDLKFPEDNVYDVKQGLTRSVCDGYWLFLKPLEIGKHHIYFKGETALTESHTLQQLKTTQIYSQIQEHINKNLTFRLEVSYELTVTK